MSRPYGCKQHLGRVTGRSSLDMLITCRKPRDIRYERNLRHRALSASYQIVTRNFFAVLPKALLRPTTYFFHALHLIYITQNFRHVSVPTDDTIVFIALKYCASHARRRLPPLPTALIAHTLTAGRCYADRRVALMSPQCGVAPPRQAAAWDWPALASPNSRGLRHVVFGARQTVDSSDSRTSMWPAG